METLETPESTSGRKRSRPNRLREFRLNAELTQIELAEAIGTTQSCVAEAETSGKGMGEARWERAAKILGTNVLTLRGWAKVYAAS